MNVGPSASPFQLSDQESDQKTKAELFSCFVAGRVGQSNRANAIMAVCFVPSRIEWGAVSKEGLDEKWHILAFLQLFPSKPIETRAHIQVLQSGWWWEEVAESPPSPAFWDNFKVFRASLDGGKMLVSYSRFVKPFPQMSQIQNKTVPWLKTECTCSLLSTFWYGISKSPLMWEFRLGCKSPHKWLSSGVALYSLP